MLDYPFTQEDAQLSYDEWGCNCGPSALAFVLQTSLDSVRLLIPGFDSKRYTSPSMMKAALSNIGKRYRDVPACTDLMHQEKPCLVRIQWTGPWTRPGANPKWAYRQTHWIATFVAADTPIVFDINSGMVTLPEWVKNVVPRILATYPRADGGWHPTHIWEIQ